MGSHHSCTAAVAELNFYADRERFLMEDDALETPLEGTSEENFSRIRFV